MGGCVRDLLMGRAPKDFDITTDALPEETKQIFSNYHVIETGLKHGTVTVMIDHEPYEITTYRTDNAYLDHRHPESVTFGSSLQEDLQRRDFTINAMAYNPSAGLIDPYGGLTDLENGMIRAVGDPDTRFNEDALRILRAIRFASRYGYAIEENTERSLHENRKLLKYVSIERIVNEFDEIICNNNVIETFTGYRDIIETVFPELSIMFDYDQHNHHHCWDLWDHTIRVIAAVKPDRNTRYAALLHDLGKPAAQTEDVNGEYHFRGHQNISMQLTDAFLKRLHFSNHDRQEIDLLIVYHDTPLVTKRTIKKILSECDLETYKKLVDLKHADNQATAEMFHRPKEYFEQLIHEGESIIREQEAFRISDLDVNGNDMLELGIEPVRIGKILNDLLDKVISEQLNNDYNTLISYVRRTYL